MSTFTAQIRHLSGVWDRLGPGALVILDEFGAGTDPAQGAALAQAVLDEVMDAGSTVVAATHFPALKAYALTRDKVRAAVGNEQARLQAEVDASRARHQRLRDVVLPAAEKAARGADVAIQKGAMSLTDYLDTQRSLRSARIEATLARAELARAGLLQRLAGDTP